MTVYFIHTTRCCLDFSSARVHNRRHEKMKKKKIKITKKTNCTESPLKEKR